MLFRIIIAEIAAFLMVTLSSSFAFTGPQRSRPVGRENDVEFHEGVHPSLMPSSSLHSKKMHRPLISSLASTAARDVDNFDTRQEDEGQPVLYQKVIRIPKQSSNTFLIQLITYVQTMYELPPNLPMPFELRVPEDATEDDDGCATSANRAVLTIESPLGSCLEVEIVGIYIDEEVQSGPSMAMVAVKKRNDPNGSSSSVSQALFAASEKAITQSLDRGLQDLEEGRVSVPISDPIDEKIADIVDDADDEVDAAMKRLGYRNAVDSASKEMKSLPVKDAIIERDGLGNSIIESGHVDAQESTRETHLPRKGSPKTTRDDTPVEKAGARQQKEEANRRSSPKSSGEDYAVQMAKRRAEAMMQTVRAGTSTSSAERTVAISGGESDFAVRAAKRAAARRLRSESSVQADAAAKPSKGSESRPRDSQETQQKVQNLSSDEMFLKLQKIAKTSAQKSWTKTISKAKANKAKAESPSGAASAQSRPPEKTEEEIRDDILQISSDNKEIQDELKAVTDLMQDDEEELSPEDLLARVLKFGEEQEKEEKPGYGFVDGAMSKARELLNQEDQELQYREMDSKDRMRMEEEDELKRIFGAGQTAVEDKLSEPTAANLAKPSITDEDIDALIDADDSIPRNARVLDDGLAELEVRMGKSSDGEVGPNELFDVFSGPETYNPNVDPESAVNWPGAKEGTRTDVRLAADLSRALKQAQFAAAIVSQMREEEDDEGTIHYYVGTKEIPSERVHTLKYCVSEAIKAGIIEDPELLLTERSRLQMVVDEIMSQPEERLEEIAMSYKDLLLSDNLVALMKERLNAMAYRDNDARRQGDEDRFKERHGRERAILINLAKIGQGLVKDAQALGAELEVSMLEIIRSICEVAMDPSHKDEEETAIALKDAVRDMRPLLDDAFVAYLKYAIAEEEGKLARGGVLDDPEHNRWLFVLKIIQEGVYSELSVGVKRYIDHIWYVLRMKTKSERKALLKQLVDVMPTMDIRPFVKVVDNIVGSLGSAVRGEFADGVLLGDMTNQLLQLQRDVNEILPPDRINELSKDADVWVAKQRELLLERRNATRQRLEAAKETGNVDVDEIIKPGHEAELFD